MDVSAKLQDLSTPDAFIHFHRPWHGGDGESVPLAGWQAKPEVSPFPPNDLYVLVLHVPDVGRADVAVDHEHDQIRQVLGHLDALDQTVSRSQLATRLAKVGTLGFFGMCSPLDFLASQLFGHLGNFFVFAHVEPASGLVLNAHLGKLGDVLDEAVPGGMLQNLARDHLDLSNLVWSRNNHPSIFDQISTRKNYLH